MLIITHFYGRQYGCYQNKQLCNRLVTAVFEVKMMVWVKCSILWAFPWGAPAKLAVETKPLKYFLGCG